MSEIADITLKTSGSTALLLAAIICAAALSYYVYRNTIPPVPGIWRGVLASLRGMVIVLILLLLFEPILSITRKRLEKPVVAVLVDNSASMALVDDSRKRSQEVAEILATDVFRSPSSDLKMRFYSFSSNIEDEGAVVPDSLPFTGDGTDIRSALLDLKERLVEQYFASVILISDGADNLGDSPVRVARNYGVPIHVLAVGDPAEQKDLLISNYVTNEIIYAETEVPVEVYIKSSGFNNRRIPVSLSYEGKELDTQFITLSGDGLEQKVRLHFTPGEEGIHKFDITVPEIEGELTNINNRKSFYAKVLKSKIKTLIVAGAPSADFKFLRRALEKAENIEVANYVEKFRGEFYQRSTPAGDTKEYDCILFVDYPSVGARQRDLDHFRKLLAAGRPAMFLLGKNTDLDKLMQWQDFLPIGKKPRRLQERMVYPRVMPAGLFHPLLRLAENDSDSKARWHELPPVFTNLQGENRATSSATIIAADPGRSEGSNDSRTPLVSVLAVGKRKSIAIWGYGLWRWDLLMWGAGKTNDTYLRFFRNAVRWLTTQEDGKLVKVVSNKEIYRSGEEVQFSAQVYFEDYQPVNGAEVVVQLESRGTLHELTLTGIGDGRYEGSFQVLAGGNYQFSGTAHQQGRVLGRDAGKFSVEPFSLEYQNTRMNEDLLRQIAAESGGKYLTPEVVETLRADLSFPEKYLMLTSEWELWHRIPVMILCLALLTGEWFIRKRKGML